MITREIQILWWDWLSTAERLLKSLKDQTNALTTRNVDQIDTLQPELERLMEHMRKLDEEAVVSATKLADNLGVDPKFRSISEALEKAEAQQFNALATRVSAVSKNVRDTLAKNRALIENELSYVNGTLAMVAMTLQDDENSYKSKAPRRPALVNQVA